MNVLPIVVLIGLVSCDTSAPPVSKEKGFIDWVQQIIGSGPPGSTTLRPVTDPPENCPACQCGIPRTRRRIVGGYETKELEFPWMAVLLYNKRFYCAGSLINHLYVVTAAHCTSGFRKEKMTVRFLEHDRTKLNETKTVDRNVSAIIRHLRYNPGTYDNDIALLKLEEGMDLSNALKKIKSASDGDDGDIDSGDASAEEDIGVRPVCLPEPSLSYAGMEALVTGWGTTEEGGSVSNTLQEVRVPIISNADCRKTAYKNRITDNMLCAGEPEGGRDACQGDSGGPLHVHENKTGTHHLAGVVSWGEGCARPDRPGVYTRVNRYLTWLKSNTKDACYCH